MKYKSRLLLLSVLITLLTLAGCNQPQLNKVNAQPKNTETELSIPEPENMTVDIKVYGRVSTLNHIDIKFVGKNIPYTYSAGKINNSKDYDWWVSKHFALKSDLPVEKVRLYLELLEMSYPHYVELFGAEPANIERQRIAVVYGSSRNKVREAMFDDGFRRGVHANAGGETMYYNRAGYSFPSHREQHQRYIVIHETMHAFHMALTGHSTWAPNWITEGLADAIAHHVYDSKLKQLSVMVLDRAPMNYVETGLKQYAELNQPTISEINDNPSLKRGLNFFIIHFLLSDPERALQFALFRDKLMQANPYSDATLPVANQLLKQTFPEWQKLEEEFKNYVQSLSSSFHIVQGPWEQDGNDFWIRSKSDHKRARLDINLKLGDLAVFTNNKFDFPGPDNTPLIDAPKRGENPNIGMLVNYVPEQINRGEIGLLLGVHLSENNMKYRQNFIGTEKSSEDRLLSVVIQNNAKITISGQNLNAPPRHYALDQNVQNDVLNHNQLGINLGLQSDRLSITLKTPNSQQSISFPVSEILYDTLLDGSLALVSNGNNHQLRPYFDDGRAEKEKATAKHTGSNPWFIQQSEKLRLSFNQCSQGLLHRSQCAKQLNLIYQAMESGNITFADTQIETLYETLWQNADKETLMELSGYKSTIEFDHSAPFLRVVNPNKNAINYSAKIKQYGKNGTVLEPLSLTTKLNPGVNNLTLELHDLTTVIDLEDTFHNNQHVNNTQRNLSVMPFDGVQLSTEFQLTDNKLSVSATLTGPYSGNSEGKLTFEILPQDGKHYKTLTKNISFDPYSTNTYQHVFNNVDNVKKPLNIRVNAELIVDGEDISLSKQHFIN